MHLSHLQIATVPDLALVALAVFVMPGLAFLAGLKLARSAPGTKSLIGRYWLLIFRGWLTVAVLILVWRFERHPIAELGLDIPVGTLGLAGLGAVAVIAVLFAIQISRLTSLSGEKLDKLKSRIDSLKITPRTREEFWLFIIVAITAGVWEELLYRGFLIWFLEARITTFEAVLLSSLIFGIGHAYQGWRGVRNTGFLGLAFAAFFVSTRSLWWLMALHALIDIHGGIVAYRVTVRSRKVPAAA